MIEEWRAIKKMPGYEVSNMGNVRDAKTKKEVRQVVLNGKMAAAFKLKNHKVRNMLEFEADYYEKEQKRNEQKKQKA